MAYAFDQTMGILGLTDPEQQQSNTTLSSDEGAVGSSAQSNVSPQAPKQPVNQPTAGGKNAIMQRNVSKAKAPADLGKMQSNIQTAREGIKNEANSYIQAADDAYEMDDKTIRSNIQSFAKGQQPSDKQQWLQYFQSAPNLVKDIDLKTDTNVKDLDLLRNDAGIRELFRRQQDPEGTLGEAALDTALLRKNADFGIARDATVQDYDNLQNERKTIERESRQKAQDLANVGADAYKGRVRSVALDMADDYDALAAQREAAFDAELAAAEEARRAGIGGQASAAIEAMKASGAYTDPSQFWDISDFLNANDDASQYYTAGKTGADTNASQFYTGDEASEWNNIMSLIGQSGETRAGGDLAGTSAANYLGGGFNADAFKQKAIERATFDRDAQIAREQQAVAQMKAQEKREADERARIQAEEEARVAEETRRKMNEAIEDANRKDLITIADRAWEATDPVARPAIKGAEAIAKAKPWKLLRR